MFMLNAAGIRVGECNPGFALRGGKGMAQKIATVSTVFAACDRLDAANERWNREDVRDAVGGGGYVVIDPLIRAWRELKPLREVAPTTPAELLHQVATTLEAHISDFVKETESRQVERQQVFDTTVSELSERLASLESALAEKEASLQAMSEVQSGLREQLEDSLQSIEKLNVTNAQLVTENDGLRGQITRQENEHKETVAKLAADARSLVEQTAKERIRANDEHASALSTQRQELVEAAEQSENRLMVLLDQERQAAKESTEQLSRQLSEETEKAQSHREKTIELESTIRELQGQNGKLASDLTTRSQQCSTLLTDLEIQKDRASTVEQEFHAYKERYKISGDLGALQIAVKGMQAKLEQRSDR
jgi:chromosome segregation ATPase